MRGVAAQEAGVWDFPSTVKTMLEGTVHWLDRINPDAVSSLREGLEETDGGEARLAWSAGRTLATTNPIENALCATRRYGWGTTSNLNCQRDTVETGANPSSLAGDDSP